MILIEAAQHLTRIKTIILLPHFKGAIKTNQLMGICQGDQNNNLITSKKAIAEAKDRNQQTTSQTSMVLTFRLTSKNSSDRSKKRDYNLSKHLKVRISKSNTQLLIFYL
jgi:hypothetical protein